VPNNWKKKNTAVMKEGSHANLAYEDHRRKRICEQLCDNTFE
jgi:hypothetical protein